MLHKEAVEPATLELIKILQNDPVLGSFCLVGGTALALQIGHRKSVDIDLFSVYPFDIEYFTNHLEEKYSFQLNYSQTNTIKGVIDGIQIDLITHKYPYIEPPMEIEGVKLLSPKDICAMKVNAIAGNGTRVKDFIDIYFLLKEFTFDEIIHYFTLKYGSRSEFHAIKSLAWFDDIDEKNWPFMLLETHLKLEDVKSIIISERNAFLNQLK
jgi:hypothetical protein